ncbi:diguanylate cyclase (GGDEF) domain protein [Eubacterium sp. CAG:252]|nr:diguanylate cyclase (GGDEF) domain protein [Eubacterium sp. CAG:252]
MFDLNNLKLVNGNLGHEMGDKYIEAFSALLASLQNDRISAYRVGGDEFSVIMEKTNAVEIHKVLDKLEEVVEKYNVKHNIKISYARGYEISTRDHYYLMEELSKRADSNMYRNKQTMKRSRMNMEKSV